MKMEIQKDLARMPNLFCFDKPIEAKQLEDWLKSRNFFIPDDLRELWCELGAGDIFESESILSPFGDAEVGDDVDSVNAFHWEKGMPLNYLIVHVGLDGLTVTDMKNGQYLSVQETSYIPIRAFKSLEDWYANFIRKEYAPRYGLI